MPTTSDIESLERILKGKVRGDVSFDKITRGLYSTDASIYQIAPAGVVCPRDADDVLFSMRAATEHNVPIVPRGGGTSLGGQGVGPGLVIDFSKYMNRILLLNVSQRWVRVEPGVVLDNLNATLAPHNLHFAPDPATGNRATIGGMIGNNSAGTKSIVYGMTRDHVLETDVAMTDGSVVRFGELSADQYERRAKKNSSNAPEAQILQQFKHIIDSNREEIARKYPKIMRRVQGYNLDSFVDTDCWNLSSVIVGSEGTLGVVLEAKLNLEPLPKSRALCVVHFSQLLDAIRAVGAILKHDPSAVEILDSVLLSMARQNLSIAPLCGFLQGDPGAVLVVEFFGDTPADTEHKTRTLAAALRSERVGYAHPVITEASEQQKVWAVRKNGLGLMLGMIGDRKPLAFIEDCCLPLEVLPAYVDRILKFCTSRNVQVAMYAHVSVGVIHVRPMLNLKDRQDIDNMKAIADFAFSLVTRYGGSWSGEHGDGRVRSPYLEKYFGPQIYHAFRQVKKVFDPQGLMNPGCIIDPDPMDHNLRYGSDYETPTPTTEYHYREQGSFAWAVEMCNGVGTCRQTLEGTMCPSYRLTRDEKHSPRGRANALRLAMTAQLGFEGMTDPDLLQVTDLCLSCKSCKSECPSNVDIAKLKSEFLQKQYDAHGAPVRKRMIAASPKMAATLSGRAAPIVNWVQRRFLFRLLLQVLAGFDRRRQLPNYAREPFPKWFDERKNTNGSSDKKVVLFDDTYMNYHEPQIGISAVELLESCGYEVILAQAGCCQRPRISNGFLRKARIEGEITLRNLDVFIERGLQVAVCEPACWSALTDDLPDLIPDEQLGMRIRENVFMIDEFLARQLQQGKLKCEFTSPFEKVLIHGHCHQKALSGTTFMKELLRRVPGISVDEIDSGCCGMAGSFGYEKEHYQQSLQIGEESLFPAIRDREEGTAVVTCGFSCRHQIAHATNARPLHWVQTIRGVAPAKE